MKIYSTTEARKKLGDLVNQVKYKKIAIGIGRYDKCEVLIVPAPELDEEIPVTKINAEGGAFDFLEDEPDIYTLDDLKKRYV